MKKIISPLLVLFIILSACEFEPQGLYEVDVAEVTNPPEITVDLNLATDTIYISSNGSSRLTYSTDDPLIRYAHFSLNQQQLALIESTSGSFSIHFNSNSHLLKQPYTLSVQLFRSTGSGSLADKMNMEGFVYSTEFTLIFVTESELASQIKRIVPENGSLKVEWEKFIGIGFKKYHVFNSVFNKIAIITDQNQTSCFDPSYIGYNADYYVVTEAEDDSYISDHVFFEDGLPSANASKTQDGRILIQWDKSKYENNLSGYRIFEFLPTFNELNEITFITNLSDTSFIFNEVKFAAKTRFFVQSVGKENEIVLDKHSNYQYLTSVTEDLYLGDKIPMFSYEFFYNPLGINCFYSSNGYLYKFDCDQQSFSDSIPSNRIDISASPNGNQILLAATNSLHLVDTKTMGKTNEIPLSMLPEEKMPYRQLLSNVEKGVIVNNSGNYYFYDFQKNEVLAQFSIDGETNHTDRMEISYNGNFFCTNHIKGVYPNYSAELYKLDGDQAIQVWTGNNITYFDFDPVNNQFLYFKDKKLITVSLSDLSIIKEVNFEDPFLFDIDWNRREYISLNEGRNLFSICDVETGEIKTQFRTFNFDGEFSYFQYIFLSNKTLFTYGNQGLKLQLPYD